MLVLPNLSWKSTLKMSAVRLSSKDVTDVMIQIEGKDWYPDMTGSGSLKQVEVCREDAR